MISNKELNILLQKLMIANISLIAVGHSSVTVKIFENNTKICLTANVYSGENYISKSVRNSLLNKPNFNKNFSSYLLISEENFGISINYLGSLNHVNKPMFRELLEEFGDLADQWRAYLDEHDKHDLIYIHNKNLN